MCVIDLVNVGLLKFVGEGYGEWFGKGFFGLGLVFWLCCFSFKFLLWLISVFC